MHLLLFLQALFALNVFSIPLAAPEIAADDPDIVVPDAEVTAGFSYSTVVFKCYQAPPAPYARLDYNECNSSLVEFKQRYPPASTRKEGYTLTHHQSVPNTIYCPVTIDADPQPFGCGAVFDYRSYPHDKDVTDPLTDIRELGEALIKTCVKKERYFGGRVVASYGQIALELSLETNMRGAIPGTTNPETA